MKKLKSVLFVPESNAEFFFTQLRADEYQTLDGTGYWKLSPHT
jgi:hypothetical protein